MSTTTKLDGAVNRMTFHIDRMLRYADAVSLTIRECRDVKVQEFFLQTQTVMLLAFLEEFFANLAKIATLHQSEEVRRYFRKYGNEEKQQLVREGCDPGILGRLAEAECSFKRNAKKLKRIFDVLFGFSPFPDSRSEDLILDLNLVRNVIAHRGGWPDENFAKKMRTPGVIVVDREIDTSADGEPPRITRFYKLDLRKTTFCRDAIQAAKETVTYIHGLLQQDARYRYGS